MNIEGRREEGCKLSLYVKVEESIVEKEFSLTFDRMTRSVRTKGFRRGRAPRGVLESRFAKEAEEEVLRALIEKNTKDALEREKIAPLAGPWIKDVKFSKDRPLFFRIDVEVLPKFDPPDWRSIKLKRKKIKIKDKDIKSALAEICESKAEMREKDGAIKKGDVAVVDFTVYPPNAEPKESFGVYIDVGKGVFPEKFEKELVGLKAGEEKGFEIKMPKDTKDEELSGKKVRFQVKVLGVKEKILPKADDDFAKKVGDFNSLKELKNSIAEDLKKSAQALERSSLKRQMVAELLKKTSFPLPSAMVNNEMQNILNTLLYNLKREGRSFEEFLEQAKKSKEEFRKELTEDAKEKVRTLLILNSIAEREGIEVTDAEFEKWAKENFAPGHIKEALSDQKRGALMEELRIEKTLDFLIDNAK